MSKTLCFTVSSLFYQMMSYFYLFFISFFLLEFFWIPFFRFNVIGLLCIVLCCAFTFFIAKYILLNNGLVNTPFEIML